MRSIGFFVSVVLLLFLGASSGQSFLKDWALPETPGQRMANLGQLLAALTGLSAGIGALLRRSWAGKAALGFAAALALTAWAGPVAWGESGVLQGLLDAGLGFLLGFVLYLGVRRSGGSGSAAPGTRPAGHPPTAPGDPPPRSRGPETGPGGSRSPPPSPPGREPS